MLTPWVYQLFSVLCGWLEAILYDKRGAEAFDFNEHTGMVAQRTAAVLAAVAAVVDYQLLGWWAAVGVVPLVLWFPLTHDESYNFTRLWLKAKVATTESLGELSDRSSFALAWQQYTYGYQSLSTTARNDFNGRQRTRLAVAGLLAYAGALLWRWLA